ncbi:MAG: class I SAM-dependent methyltransferase [Mariprofundaceae bacterium]|nr:class I SAM-dependent methyltransferase [Mariprofundaceae bacterium]
MARHGYLFSEHAYFDFVKHEYVPNAFERIEDDARFVPESHNAWVNGQRFHRMLQMLERHHVTAPGSVMHGVDIGLFPGTWIRLARHFWPDIEWQGVGLCISGDFRAWAAEEGIALAEADMDPFYARGDVKTSLPFEDSSLDLVVASEIFEHLISPLLFLEETSRTLKPGGLMLLTTPNVSHIGAIVHLLKGGSNYERLERSPMFLVEDEWRGHIRFYSKAELEWLGERYGFEVIDHRYYHDDYPISALKNRGVLSSVRRAVRRLSGVVPWFRGGHIVMYRRKEQPKK